MQYACVISYFVKLNPFQFNLYTLNLYSGEYILALNIYIFQTENSCVLLQINIVKPPTDVMRLA
jgi:hypothetical protein